MKTFEHLEDLKEMAGQSIGVGEWMEVDQARIDAFADVTLDQQWIHVDPARAAQGPYGVTVAHGFLTLSLVPALRASAFRIGGVRMGINYGLNKVRFPAPVPAGSRIRANCRLLAYQPLDGGAQLTTEISVEREGADKPVCVAEFVSRHYI